MLATDLGVGHACFRILRLIFVGLLLCIGFVQQSAAESFTQCLDNTDTTAVTINCVSGEQLIAVRLAFLGRSSTPASGSYCPSPSTVSDCIPNYAENTVDFTRSCNTLDSCLLYESAATTFGLCQNVNGRAYAYVQFECLSRYVSPNQPFSFLNIDRSSTNSGMSQRLYVRTAVYPNWSQLIGSNCYKCQITLPVDTTVMIDILDFRTLDSPNTVSLYIFDWGTNSSSQPWNATSFWAQQSLVTFYSPTNSDLSTRTIDVVLTTSGSASAAFWMHLYANYRTTGLMVGNMSAVCVSTLSTTSTTPRTTTPTSTPTSTSTTTTTTPTTTSTTTTTTTSTSTTTPTTTRTTTSTTTPTTTRTTTITTTPSTTQTTTPTTVPPTTTKPTTTTTSTTTPTTTTTTPAMPSSTTISTTTRAMTSLPFWSQPSTASTDQSQSTTSPTVSSSEPLIVWTSTNSPTTTANSSNAYDMKAGGGDVLTTTVIIIIACCGGGGALLLIIIIVVSTVLCKKRRGKKAPLVLPVSTGTWAWENTASPINDNPAPTPLPAVRLQGDGDSEQGEQDAIAKQSPPSSPEYREDGDGFQTIEPTELEKESVYSEIDELESKKTVDMQETSLLVRTAPPPLTLAPAVESPRLVSPTVVLNPTTPLMEESSPMNQITVTSPFSHMSPMDEISVTSPTAKTSPHIPMMELNPMDPITATSPSSPISPISPNVVLTSILQSGKKKKRKPKKGQVLQVRFTHPEDGSIHYPGRGSNVLDDDKLWRHRAMMNAGDRYPRQQGVSKNPAPIYSGSNVNSSLSLSRSYPTSVYRGPPPPYSDSNTDNYSTASLPRVHATQATDDDAQENPLYGAAIEFIY